MRWLNFHVLSSVINKFPEDFQSNDGAQLFQLIKYLTGKDVPGKVDTENN